MAYKIFDRGGLKYWKDAILDALKSKTTYGNYFIDYRREN